MKNITQNLTAKIPLVIGAAFYLITFAYSSLFGYPYEIPKFLVYSVLTCVLGVATLYDKGELRGIADQKIELLGTVSLIAFSLSVLLSTQGAIGLALSHFFLWILLAYMLLHFVRKLGSDKFLENFIVTLPLLITIYVLYSWFFEFIFEDNPVKPFWGNKNLSADFCALMSLQLLFFLKLRPKSSYRSWIYFLLLANVGLLLYFASRAALLGLVFASFVFYFDKIRKIFSGYRLHVFAGVLVVLILSFFVLKGMGSVEGRISFWMNTLYLIRDHPFFGVGPSGFEVLFEQYNGRYFPSHELHEGRWVTSPHNFILEIIALIGIPGALVFLSTAFLLFWRVLKLKKSLARQWVLCSAALLSPLFLFAFPQSLPFTSMYLALLVAVALSLIPSRKLKLNLSLKLTGLGLSVAVFILLLMKAYSEHLTIKLPYDPQEVRLQLRKACALDSENWRACAGLARKGIAVQEWESADWAIEQLARRFEGFHPHLILLGEYHFQKGDKAEGCKFYRRYQDIFKGGKTSIDTIISANCAAL